MKSEAILSSHFPAIRTREEILQIITESPGLYGLFQNWGPAFQEDFLDACSGKKGMKILYDGVFKEIFNPEQTPERLSELLSLLLGRTVTVKTALPNDSVRLGEESSLLYTDIMVELDDKSLANVEIQKIGYAFPGERCACYSADHLLRQYKRVRGEKGKRFLYQNVKRVYTLVFFEQSPRAFHEFPGCWLHKFRQQSDTGLEMELLQEYVFIPLDIYRKNKENKGIETTLEAWLAFLSFTAPERIEELITLYPKFKAMYQDVYDLCQNMEKVMHVYSKELRQMDHNTVMYMIDELQEMVDQKRQELKQQEEVLKQQDETLIQQRQELTQKDKEIAALKAQLAQYQAKE